MPFMPQRTYFGDEFSDQIGRRTCDPPVVDDCCTRYVPHHTTMINDRKPDASPPTVRELVRRPSTASVRVEGNGCSGRVRGLGVGSDIPFSTLVPAPRW